MPCGDYYSTEDNRPSPGSIGQLAYRKSTVRQLNPDDAGWL
jgi:hypothetical protein